LIAPGRLARAGLILFRGFVGLGIDDAVRVPTVITKNRDRLLTTGMSRKVPGYSQTTNAPTWASAGLPLQLS
jgi:hypothetical protein